MMESVAERPPRSITKVTCGFILQVEQSILFCKPTGGSMLDLPKGLKEHDETPLAAALRELMEETGLILGTTGIRQKDLGQEAYNKQKNLHLFYVRLPELELDKLWCQSSFTTRWNTIEPEVSGYELLTLRTAWPKMSKGMKEYFIKKREHLSIDPANWPEELTS